MVLLLEKPTASKSGLMLGIALESSLARRLVKQLEKAKEIHLEKQMELWLGKSKEMKSGSMLVIELAPRLETKLVKLLEKAKEICLVRKLVKLLGIPSALGRL